MTNDNAPFNLDELDSPGQAWIRLIMKAEDTEHNRQIHNEFREYSRAYCKNDYTLALERLMRADEFNAKTEILSKHILTLEQELNALRMELSESEEVDEEQDDNGVF